MGETYEPGFFFTIPQAKKTGKTGTKKPIGLGWFLVNQDHGVFADSQAIFLAAVDGRAVAADWVAISV